MRTVFGTGLIRRSMDVRRGVGVGSGIDGFRRSVGRSRFNRGINESRFNRRIGRVSLDRLSRNERRLAGQDVFLLFRSKLLSLFKSLGLLLLEFKLGDGADFSVFVFSLGCNLLLVIRDGREMGCVLTIRMSPRSVIGIGYVGRLGIRVGYRRVDGDSQCVAARQTGMRTFLGLFPSFALSLFQFALSFVSSFLHFLGLF